MTHLKQATIEANRAQVNAIIEEIRPLDERLAKSLSALVEDFRFDTLVELTTGREGK